MINKSDIILVDDWRPSNENEVFLIPDNKLVIIPFERIFNHDFGSKTISSFIISETKYSNNLDKICRYSNYFINFYDTDKEILLNYLKIKTIIDDKSKTIKPNAFIKMVYEFFFTPNIVEKIKEMVEDNYIVNLKKDGDKKYDESMEFNNDHGKIIFRISIGINLLLPLLNHYLYISNNVEKSLYKYFMPLFEIFTEPGIDMINKLSNYTLKKIHQNFESNKGAWEQRNMLGDDNYLVHADKVFKKIVVTDVIHKFVFNQNIINMLSVVIDNNLRYQNRGKYKYLPKKLNDEKNVEGLSELDKFEMLFNKIDESLTILSDCNKETVIKRIEALTNILVSNDEIQFYKDFYKFDKFQVNLVKYYYARYFNGFRDLNMLTRDQYVKLLIILKRRLQSQGYLFLPFILSGNIKNKLNTRTIQNKKFIMKVETSTLYQELINNKFAYIMDLKEDNSMILNIISTVLNTAFSYVEYDAPYLLGEQIETIPDVVCEEMLTYLNQI